MKIKKQLSITKSLTSATGIIVLSTIFALSTFANNNQYAIAQVTSSDMAVDITNNLDENLIFNTIENREHVKIKSDPPSEVKAKQSGGFKIAKGDAGAIHLKVQYYVGEKGSSETVTFGFKGDTWSTISCFTETPSDIKGSHENCDKANKKFFFSPN